MSFISDLLSAHHAVDFPAIHNDGNKSGYLVFEDTGVVFHQNVALMSNGQINIPAETIKDIDIKDLSHSTSRPTIPRIMFLKWWAMAVPKTEHSKGARVDISTYDGKFYSFTINGFSDADIRTKASEIIHKYSSTNSTPSQPQ